MSSLFFSSRAIARSYRTIVFFSSLRNLSSMSLFLSLETLSYSFSYLIYPGISLSLVIFSSAFP